MESAVSLLLQTIREHVEEFWPNSTISEEVWGEGPIEQTIPGFRVLKIKSRTPKRPVIYMTYGCFTLESEEHIRHEFFLVSPKEERRHVETLTMLANFHADERYRLAIGSTVNIGDPWMPGSQCDHLLVSLPYCYGPKLEWLKLDNNCVQILWALPITAREAAFVELNGYDSLEQKFDEVTVDYVNPARSSVV
ncbi:MAG: suppressor of fused domain protein [Candidatus Angelobacter sp.]